ncbi:MAG: sugar nucleotide-binding protein [Treponema sp.]|nr:sugar nucleotide-binding protein [Treponema sp.]
MIWLLGNKGLIGSEIQNALSENKLPFVASDIEIDISSPDALESFASSVDTSSYFPSNIPRSQRKIKWIINCVSYSGDDSDKAHLVNSVGACNIARVARKIGAKLIHISSEYVYNNKGNEPFTEDCVKAPENCLGISKSEGEDLISKEMTQYYIIRPSCVYGRNDESFVNSLLSKMNENSELAISSKIRFSPTWASDVASVIIRLIDKTDHAKGFIGAGSTPAFGVYNFSDTGDVSLYDFAVELLKIGRKTGIISNDCKILSESSNSDFDFDLNAGGEYFVLNNDKISAALKFRIPSWQKSLEKYIKSIKF